MAKPRILLLDEPSLGLAPAIIDELFDVLAGLRDEGVTILLVDQMAALALALADRGYVLESGRIVGAGPAAALAGDPALEGAYLGPAQGAARLLLLSGAPRPPPPATPRPAESGGPAAASQRAR